VVLASVHSGLKEDRDTMTRRVIGAMENEYVDIVGHPTGRIIGKRLGFEIDMPRIIEVATTTGTALECNASPWRLDLDDMYVKPARDRGALISVGTDSHQYDEFSFMRFGVTIARRGWCGPGDLVNTRSLKDLLGWVSG